MIFVQHVKVTRTLTAPFGQYVGRDKVEGVNLEGVNLEYMLRGREVEADELA